MEKIKSPKELDAFRNSILEKQSPDKKRVRICMTGCRAAGAGKIRDAFNEEIKKQNLEDKVEIVETGCHGFCAKAPVIAIDVPRCPEDIFYQQVSPEDVPEIISETLQKDNLIERLLYTDPKTGEKMAHTEDIPFFKAQMRNVLRNYGKIDPLNVSHYIARDGYAAFSKAISTMTPEEIIDTVKASGLRGRGGAGFPTGIKWGITRASAGDVKYLICNGGYDDGGDPHSILEGMLIAAYAIGAQEGFIYVRAEYPIAVRNLNHAIDKAEKLGLLGENILGTDFCFKIHVKEGTGAFISGEETALMMSIEGKRGMPRSRPPFPANQGLWGRPTNINNFETYANIPLIILRGVDWFSSIGTESSKGTKILSLSGKVNNAGLIEVPMGITLGEIIFDIGGGIPDGKKFKAVQMGGQSGGCLSAEHLNVPIDYESLTEVGAIMGSGGMIVMDENTCVVDTARYFIEFLQNESCGKCVPCRLGTKRMLEILESITQGKGKEEDIDLLVEMAYAIKDSALCGLGKTAPNPILTTIEQFRDEYEAHIKELRCPAGECETLVPAFCRSGCPAEVNVPVYVAHIADGEYDKALAVHREANPFPSICGRVCPAFCERKCRRGLLDEPVAVRTLKRFMADQEKEQWKPPILEDDKEQRVAIVGGGPGGLTAALRLAQRGYQVTIFEAEPLLGGMMTLGIPDYRLPKDVLNTEIKSITSMENVEVRTNTKVGRDVSLDSLRDEYSAVLLAVGAPKSRKLRIPGEDSEGVIHGIDFLKTMNLGEDVSFVKGKRLAVIGGGDVAIDVARSSVRLGASEVNIVYRRRRQDMPALKEEIEAAEEEGVKFTFLLTPTEVISEEGKIVGLRCQKMKLEDENGRPFFDSSARKRPFPIEGAEVVLDIDMLVPAIGGEVETSFIDGSVKAQPSTEIVVNRGTITAEERSFVTNEEGVFAIGDAVTGPASVIEAVAQGNKVAKVIQRYLQGKEELMPPAEILQPPSEGVGEFEMAEEDGLRLRQKVEILAPEVRKNDFREVELGFLKETIAKAEARRCLRCDLEPIE